MMNFLYPTLEFLIFLPGMLLAYLPMKQHLKLPASKLIALMVFLTLLLCLGAGAVSYFLSVRARLLFFPLAAILGTAYIHTLNITLWKSASVFLAVCASFSCLGSTATAIESVLNPEKTTLWLSPLSAVAWFLMCCGFLLVAWYPATHAARTLLEENGFVQTWYVFWALPVLFIALNLFMIPKNPKIISLGRMFPVYVTISLSLLLMLCLFYVLFYLMAASINHNDRLRQENQFLSMQQARYDSLKTAIEETREARHDLRHHFDVLLGLAGKKEWATLTEYLSNSREEIPDLELHLCDNTAIDSVAGHYGLLCKKSQIPFSFVLDLPAELPIPEMNFCLVLSNLLENALEASLRTAPEKRQIKVQAYLHSEHMILLTVENAFDGTIKEKDGVFQSSKSKGNGMGIQSVRRIADKNGGYSRFSYEDGIFCANVMLRSEK